MVSPNVLHNTFDDFLEAQTIGSLQQLLNAAWHHVDVRRVLLALGLLLRPVMASGTPKMGKGLRLPLPIDPLYRPLVSAFWLDLIADFLGHADVELMFLQRAEPRPTMTLGFAGGCMVSSIPVRRAGHRLAGGSRLGGARGQRQLRIEKAFNLYQPGLSLNTARTTFNETFWGL